MESEGQSQFISNNIEEYPKKTERIKQNSTPSRRQFSRKYFLTGINNIQIEVCQVMFMNTLNISLKKIRVTMAKKKITGAGICLTDGRGHHSNHPKTSDQDKNNIRDHIKMFPFKESHYSRNKTNKKYFLNPDLSISRMYDLYKNHCTENHFNILSEFMYRKIFVEEFNLAFKKPNIDTCQLCDKFETILKCSTVNEEIQDTIEEKNVHLQMAEMAYVEKKKDKALSTVNNEILTVSFDLQKCLATPFLSSGLSFYKRQLWTFNLTIYETYGDKNYSYCYLWDETKANRGGQEVASCIYKYVNDKLDKCDSIKEIIFYSDCCPGQNRNIYMAVMFLHLVGCLKEKGRDLIIHHKFLIPGHTHMEADTIHAAIEKQKKRTMIDIELPRDWAILISSVPRKPPINVIQMEQYNFLNIKELIGKVFIHKKMNIDGEAVGWNKIRWMKYMTNNFGNILYKHSFSCDENYTFKILDLTKKTRRSCELGELHALHTNLLPLEAKKLKDLQSLLPFISESSRPFYYSLINNSTTCRSSEEESD